MTPLTRSRRRRRVRYLSGCRRYLTYCDAAFTTEALFTQWMERDLGTRREACSASRTEFAALHDYRYRISNKRIVPPW